VRGSWYARIEPSENVGSTCRNQKSKELYAEPRASVTGGSGTRPRRLIRTSLASVRSWIGLPCRGRGCRVQQRGHGRFDHGHRTGWRVDRRRRGHGSVPPGCGSHHDQLHSRPCDELSARAAVLRADGHRLLHGAPRLRVSERCDREAARGPWRDRGPACPVYGLIRYGVHGVCVHVGRSARSGSGSQRWGSIPTDDQPLTICSGFSPAGVAVTRRGYGASWGFVLAGRDVVAVTRRG
jgi:hypothetical protein